MDLLNNYNNSNTVQDKDSEEVHWWVADCYLSQQLEKVLGGGGGIVKEEVEGRHRMRRIMWTSTGDEQV